jgi:transcriptional regulator with XRE-family HTH domain
LKWPQLWPFTGYVRSLKVNNICANYLDSYNYSQYYCPPMTDPDLLRQGGSKLKRIRLRLGLSAREVERRSLQLVVDEQNPDYHLSRSWIRDVERGRFAPGTFKLVSLSRLYHLTIPEIHRFFGIKPGDIAKESGLFPPPKTHLVAPPDESEPVAASPADPNDATGVGEDTHLVSRLVDIAMRRSLFGYIGTQDRTMSPLIRPGTFVQIDVKQTHIKNEVRKGSGPFARPVYFLDIRTGYACGWCQLEDGILTLIPHPDSGVKARSFRHPNEVEVVGRVTQIYMCIEEERQAKIEETMGRRNPPKK